jgi:hypothetical protein
MTGGTYSSTSTGGRSGFAGPPDFAMPAAVIVWSVLWLTGLWLILRRGEGKGPPPPRSPAEAVPA